MRNVRCMRGNRIRPLNTVAETDDSILLDRPCASLTAQADTLSYQQTKGPKHVFKSTEISPLLWEQSKLYRRYVIFNTTRMTLSFDAKQ